MHDLCPLLLPLNLEYQAAVESAHSHAGLVGCLLEKGADPHVRRPFEYKNAIVLAEAKGFH